MNNVGPGNGNGKWQHDGEQVPVEQSSDLGKIRLVSHMILSMKKYL